MSCRNSTLSAWCYRTGFAAKLTFCGASGSVVALRLPETQLGKKGLCLLLLLPLLLGSCGSAARPEVLVPLLSKVAGRPLRQRTQQETCDST